MSCGIAERAVKQGIPAWLVPGYWQTWTPAVTIGDLVTWRFSHHSLPETPAGDLLISGILGLHLGAKRLYGLEFGLPGDLHRRFRPAGFSLYGGLAGLPASWTISHGLRRFRRASFLDCSAAGLAVTIVLGRLGRRTRRRVPASLHPTPAVKGPSWRLLLPSVRLKD